jgi:hypothetical protein
MFLHHHNSGDWGEACCDDWEENERLSMARPFSVYRTANGVKFRVITEWDRSVTTILLSQEC